MTSTTVRAVRDATTRRTPCTWISVDLPGAARSVGVARQLVVDTLCHWGLEQQAATGALLVTELATNAVLHTRDRLQVDVELLGDVVRVGVRDTSPQQPQRRSHAVAAATGRGLGLVELLSSGWGSEPQDDGSPWRKSVWFELPTDARRLPAPADGSLLATA